MSATPSVVPRRRTSGSGRLRHCRFADAAYHVAVAIHQTSRLHVRCRRQLCSRAVCLFLRSFRLAPHRRSVTSRHGLLFKTSVFGRQIFPSVRPIYG